MSSPDIACYSKGLTGGSLPLAVTLCRREIFEAHFSHDRSRTFFHSSSYTANPIACAAANANLDLWQDRPLRARVAAVAAMQEKRARAVPGRRAISRMSAAPARSRRWTWRCAMAAISPASARGFSAFFGDRNLLLRPLGNTIYVMPPYCVTQADLDEIYAAIAEAANL